ncbi:MAG: peptidase S8 and S53 subtilisin kexin sedolisin [Actinobacteria bacterium]|nr:MAG: peptidase S8 and S53 subtilisin kexin sedolisin [Actinomycetota bacterium]
MGGVLRTARTGVASERRNSAANRSALILVALVLGTLLIQPAVEARTLPEKADPALYAMAESHPDARLPVIIREAAPTTSSAERLVRFLGGSVTHELPIVGGFSAVVPGSAVPRLTASSDVARVWGDGRVRMATVDMDQYDTYPINTVWRSAINLLQALTRSIGSGVGVAVIDTGVVPVPDLKNHVSYRVDFTPERDGLDRYGHGTHMAGIVVGDGTSSRGKYVGVAPGARLISIKVAGYNGATDVSVVIAGLQWVITHKSLFNIRVLNLSFGTDSTQPYAIDPLDFAVEQTWRAGITVVVSAGNRGPDPRTVDKPADDPYVISVGAVDTKQTNSPYDDTVAPFSSQGPTQDGFKKPDLVAPGISIVSARDPNSTIDQLHPLARVGDFYFKATGTSQAAAMVSGIVALMNATNPLLTPDQVKGILMRTATRLPNQPGSGAGEVNAGAAVNAVNDLLGMLSPANGGLVRSTGTGSLEASRGSLHVYADTNDDGAPDPVRGEVTAFGTPWTSQSWSTNSSSGYACGATSWSDASWGAKSWSGMQWDAKSWSANSWSNAAWSSDAWSAKSWSGSSWSSNDWSAKSWSAKSWSAQLWS